MGQEFKDKLFKTIISQLHALKAAFVETAKSRYAACFQATHSQFIIRILSASLFPMFCLPRRSSSDAARVETAVVPMFRLSLLPLASFSGKEKPMASLSALCAPITYYIYGLHKIVYRPAAFCLHRQAHLPCPENPKQLI